MMAAPRGPLPRSRNVLLAPLLNYVAGLRFSRLFLLTAALFLVDLAVPDLIPFADEALLGMATLVLGAWKRRKRT